MKVWPPRRWNAIAVVVALGGSLPAAGQTLPSEPIVFGDGRVTIGGDLSATFSCSDSNRPDPGTCANDNAGFFNYTDYEHSALRMFRFGLTAAVRASRHISVLGEIRSENWSQIEPYGLYVRIHPWLTRNVDVQAGRVPPVFGGFASRPYPADNILIGYPLAYQYLTSLRPDALPSTADELLAMRGRGWLSQFTLGSAEAAHGMPLVSAFRRDTGVQLHAASRALEGAVAVTTGTVGNPLVGDDNAGRQIAARAAVRPVMGLLVGASAAHGPFVTDAAARAAGRGDEQREFTQTAWGADAEYSRDYYLVRFEAIVSDWRVPVVATPAITLPLRATSVLVEGRYKLRPGLYAAARVDRLGFSEITGSTRSDEWDAPVTRVEVGGGYSLQRNLLIKLAFQRNTRDTGRVSTVHVGAVQAVFWF